MYSMGGRPRSMRSSLTTVKTCSGIGSAANDDSETFMAPTPSWPRAESMEASQSPLFIHHICYPIFHILPKTV